MLCTFTILIIELYLPDSIIRSWMLLAGVPRSVMGICTWCVPQPPEQVLAFQTNCTDISLAFSKVNVDLCPPALMLREENYRCSVLHERWSLFRSWFCHCPPYQQEGIHLYTRPFCMLISSFQIHLLGLTPFYPSLRVQAAVAACMGGRKQEKCWCVCVQKKLCLGREVSVIFSCFPTLPKS